MERGNKHLTVTVSGLALAAHPLDLLPRYGRRSDDLFLTFIDSHWQTPKLNVEHYLFSHTNPKMPGDLKRTPHVVIVGAG